MWTSSFPRTQSPAALREVYPILLLQGFPPADVQQLARALGPGMCTHISVASLNILCYLDTERFAGKLGTLPRSPETFVIVAKGPPMLMAQMRKHLSRGLCACPLASLGIYQVQDAQTAICSSEELWYPVCIYGARAIAEANCQDQKTLQFTYMDTHTPQVLHEMTSVTGL